MIQQQISCGVGAITPGGIFPSMPGVVNGFSQPYLDDRPLPDLLEPGLQSRIVLLPEQDLADLRLGPGQRLPFEGLLRLEAEDVVAQRRPVRFGDRARLQAQDLRLDVLSQLAPLECAEVAAVLRAGVARVPVGELREAGPLEQLGTEHLGLDTRSEEHTSELQSRFDLVCRLLLEKKNCKKVL